MLAISADDLESHQILETRLGAFPFPLASDPPLETAKLYGVSSDDGKRSNRAVFVIDAEGTVIHAIPWFQPGNLPPAPGGLHCFRTGIALGTNCLIEPESKNPLVHRRATTRDIGEGASA